MSVWEISTGGFLALSGVVTLLLGFRAEMDTTRTLAFLVAGVELVGAAVLMIGALLLWW